MRCSAVLVLCWIARPAAIDVPELFCETRASSATSSSLLQNAMGKLAVKTSSAIYQQDAVEIPGKLSETSLESEHAYAGEESLSRKQARNQRELSKVPHSWASRSSIAETTRRREAAAIVPTYKYPKLKDPKIDFAYCWSGEAVQIMSESAKHFDNPEDSSGHNGGFGYNEMKLGLRSLQKFAPWFNKVYLLVNGPAPPPSWAKKDPRVVMVDRCKLFPNPGDCPTNSTAACQSVLHLVPGLQEKFVYMDDDWIFLRPVAPSDFFADNGEPFLTLDVQKEWLQPLYSDSSEGPDMPPAKVPDSMYPRMFIHAPTPMLISFSAYLENEFVDWFAFIRSHRNRFRCCDAELPANGVSEMFHTIYPSMLFKTGIGKPNKRAPWSRKVIVGTKDCNCMDPSCMEDLFVRKEVKCMVLSNCRDRSLFRAAHKLVLQHIMMTGGQ